MSGAWGKKEEICHIFFIFCNTINVRSCKNHFMVKKKIEQTLQTYLDLLWDLDRERDLDLLDERE